MYSKLAFGNVRKSLKDYAVYFLTLMFGVCLFYVFSSVGDQQAMRQVSESTNRMLGLLTTMMNVASGFIAVILGFLIIYANKFLIRRRKRELGLYQCLGMSKGKVSRVLILETLFIGVIALAVGLVAGVFLSQGMSVVTAKLFQVEMSQFVFTFSSDALLKSILYFGIIFLVVMIFNTVAVSKYKLIDLFTASKKNETLHVKSLKLSVLLFLVSALFLGLAYYFIIDNGMMSFDWEFWSAIGCGIVGTFLFFFSLSGFLLRVVKSSKKIYYKGLNMFVLRQINSKITTTYISMTMICIMLLVAIGTLSTGIGATNAMNRNVERTTPFSASVIWITPDYEGEENPYTALDYLRDKGVSFEDITRERGEVNLYESGDLTYRDVYSDQILDKLSQFRPREKVEQMKPSIIPLSEYNQALKMQGVKPITLGPGEYAVNCNASNVIDDIKNLVKSGKAVTIGGKRYQPRDMEVLGHALYTQALTADSGTFIVPDEAVRGLLRTGGVLNLNFKSKDASDQDTFVQRIENGAKLEKGKESLIQTSMQQYMRDQSAGLSTVVCYLAIYVGMVFLLTSAAVLALQQLTESADNLERYRLLRKIGTEERQIRGAIASQIGIFFAMPLALALVHSAVGVSVARVVVDMFGHVNSLGSILFTAGVLVLIYGGYAVATYIGSKAMVALKK